MWVWGPECCHSWRPGGPSVRQCPAKGAKSGESPSPDGTMELLNQPTVILAPTLHVLFCNPSWAVWGGWLVCYYEPLKAFEVVGEPSLLSLLVLLFLIAGSVVRVLRRDAFRVCIVRSPGWPRAGRMGDFISLQLGFLNRAMKPRGAWVAIPLSGIENGVLFQKTFQEVNLEIRASHYTYKWCELCLFHFYV